MENLNNKNLLGMSNSEQLNMNNSEQLSMNNSEQLSMNNSEQLDMSESGQLQASINEPAHQAGQASQEALLPIELFLGERYEFRHNVLSDKTEVRMRGAQAGCQQKGCQQAGCQQVCRPQAASATWRHLDKKVLNGIAVEARKALPDEANVKGLLADVIYSDATPEWNPIAEWLDGLPAWDGKDRVSYLFGLIPGLTSERKYWLTVWLRSTVAHWQQRDALHGNECVPTLIGEQGCGKSTFCQRLLPEHLREYYLDHVNLGNKFDKEMALTNNLIVNLDELDQIRPRQQAELKQMLSKVRVNGRPIYGREQSDRLRFASFVATTNNRHPLRDHTGSRRYLCIEVPRGQLIDNTAEIDYEQLYAQVLAELQRGERYWFTAEETQAIQRANVRYQNSLDLETMVVSCFRLPEEGEFVRPLTTSEMLAIIAADYPAIEDTKSNSIRLGITLQALGYLRREGHSNHSYYAVPLRAA